MKTSAMNSSQRGFSMIEVLIAVVVLGFGLMALAALQTTIIRSSAETKAQTIALQLAKDKIEDLRSFQSLAEYKAITSSAAVELLDDASGNLSNVNFKRSWVVERFAYRPSSGTFVSVTPLIGDTPTGGTPAIYVADNEYKTIAVTVNWTDANGVTQSVRLDDAIAALSPGDGSKVVLNNANTSQARKPQVRIYDPGATGGVIPIAVGNNSSTAASNPRPVVKGRDNDIAETQFEVLTYAGTSGNVVAQSRVETAVVGCTCSTANAPAATTARGYRPTFWNGYRYAPPNVTTDKPTAGWTSVATESDRCTACCRDHRDPPGVTGAKFDPWRTTHNHYLRSDSELILANTGTYNESCRLIRVDGFFRVAADLRNDYFGFLEPNNSNDLTNPNQNLRAYAPRDDQVNVANDATTNYQNFVLKYMDDRFSNNTVFNYNTPLATSGYETTYGLNRPVNDSNLPSPISIKPTATVAAKNTSNVWVNNDSKWTHARGLYVDWIEPDALDVIKQARNNCANKTTQALRNACVLPYVPFTSINLTELADYTARLTKTAMTDNTSVIKVANNSFFDPDNSDIPTRGNVYKGTNPDPVTNNKAFVLSFMTESNSGVALKLPIDVDETILKDDQEYSIAAGTPPPVTDIEFTLNMSGHSILIPYPQAGDFITNESCRTGTGYPTTSQACSFTPDANGNMQVKIEGYTKLRQQSVPNGCKNNGTVDMPIIVDYNVTVGTNPNGSATLFSTSGDKTTLETAVLYYKPVLQSSTLTVAFSGPTYWCPSNYSQQQNDNSSGLDCSGPSNNTPVFNTNTATLKQCTILADGRVTVP
jgi:type IV pilus modification protein PilV